MSAIQKSHCFGGFCFGIRIGGKDDVSSANFLPAPEFLSVRSTEPDYIRSLIDPVLDHSIVLYSICEPIFKFAIDIVCAVSFVFIGSFIHAMTGCRPSLRSRRSVLFVHARQ